MDILQQIAAGVGYVTTIVGFIALLSKGARNVIKKFFSSNTKELCRENRQQTQDIEEIKHIVRDLSVDMEGLMKFSQQQCRDIIKRTYYKYRDEKTIPLFERKAVDKTYEIYTQVFNGNSYAKLLYEQIIMWEIDTKHDIIDSDDEEGDQ